MGVWVKREGRLQHDPLDTHSWKAISSADERNGRPPQRWEHNIIAFLVWMERNGTPPPPTSTQTFPSTSPMPSLPHTHTPTLPYNPPFYTHLSTPTPPPGTSLLSEWGTKPDLHSSRKVGGGGWCNRSLMHPPSSFRLSFPPLPSLPPHLHCVFKILILFSFFNYFSEGPLIFIFIGLVRTLTFRMNLSILFTYSFLWLCFIFSLYKIITCAYIVVFCISFITMTVMMKEKLNL